MEITHIRNATLIVKYADKKFLIDPMLADKGAYPPFPDSVRQDQNNPLVHLPTSLDQVMKDVDAVIVTHLHLDHFDEAAKKVLPKDMKMFVQNAEDAAEVNNSVFKMLKCLQKTQAFMASN
ncbi:Beta-lactamase superfamily domain-containing protein [Halobacillus aidingensis]|uniref:Beta-lactamase superfamily domain-containing protein n=1 Tax=Halobacillus aidingensis TaxID=240303 RepID=A0A1H0GHR5_HALAD|nr:Beta-lactamase superfamily domain-containing protein [Halobacillus aidingensis]